MNFYKSEFESFDEEFGIHFQDSKGELQFCHEWIKEHDQRLIEIIKSLIF